MGDSFRFHRTRQPKDWDVSKQMVDHNKVSRRQSIGWVFSGVERNILQLTAQMHPNVIFIGWRKGNPRYHHRNPDHPSIPSSVSRVEQEALWCASLETKLIKFHLFQFINFVISATFKYPNPIQPLSFAYCCNYCCEIGLINMIT